MNATEKAIYYAVFGCSLSATASNPEKPQRQIVIPGDQEISICETNRAGKSECSSMRLPNSIGKIVKILEVNSVPNALLSVIALEEKKTSLCAVTSNRKAVCARMSVPPMNQIDLSMVNGPDGKPQIMFTPDAGIPKADGYERVVQFMAAYIQVQGRITSYLNGKRKTNNASLGTGEVRPTLIDSNGGCAGDDDIDVTCEGGGGGGGSGGGIDIGGGGGGGGGGGTSCVYGPITVCSVPGPSLPPDIPPAQTPTPTLPSLCQAFGINCPTIPPPPPPIGSTSEERKQECLDIYDSDMDECSAYFGAYGTQTWLTCKERAGARLATCLRAAEGK